MESTRFLPEIGRHWRNLTAERAWLAIGVALVCALFIFVFSWERCFFDGCPDVASLAAYQPGGAPILLDRHGEPFADLTPVEQRIVPLSSLPSHVAQAFMAVEDQRFQEHHGIDLRRVGGALLTNLRSGDFEQGFSTITMQVARNVFPDRIPGQDRSLSRKLTEIRVAKEIEQRYSKQEILELYLNHIYFGNRAHGIDAASRQYFGVPAEQLTLPQAALLAALPKAPSHYDPRRHPEEARQRRDLVLTLMQRQRRIPRYIAEEARREPLRITPPPRHVPTESGLAPYFVEQVRRELEDRFGSDLYRQPLRVRTTLDARLQRAAEEELSRQLRRIENGELGKFAGRRYSSEAATPPDGTPYLQGAVVLLDARGGDVLAWVGGRDFAQSQFDRAAQARRQVGSAFKPFVYAAALRDGWVLSQPLVDLPLTVRLPDGRIWKPRNFGASYEREVTVRDALVRSKNVATVRLATAVGLADVAQAAQRVGLEEPLSSGPAMALGTAAVSPLELTSAYTAFAALGTAVEPRRILAVEDADGRVLWRSEPRRREVLDPGVAYLITDVLSEALERGTGYRVRQSGVRAPAAGKTGTTNDGADAWFVGYTPELAAGIWIGFDQPKPIVEDAAGGRVAAPIWASLIRRTYSGRPLPKPWPQPESVVSRPVDPASGLVLKDGCAPLRGASRRELFLEEAIPAAWCPGREPRPVHGFPFQVREDAEAQRARAEQLEQKEEQKLAELREAERREKERLAKELAQARAENEQQALEQKEREAREERQARLQEQKEREERIAEREAELRREEKKLLQREERASRRDPESESEVAEVEVDEPEREEQSADLSGWWELTNRIQASKYTDYVGLRLGYQIKLEQDGNRITGRGRKSTEDGRSVSGSARSPIRVSGTLDGTTLHLTFTEEGARRSSTGGFDLHLSADRTSLRGGFWSDVAGTKGSTLARRMP
ncbi:MAG TPA: PBP1A family penicillin-binding protein [Thermoanaerobaculia bacterium]|nr:PBP1A family penicillin-binding protein [Thermoanaerobaculia bacterium]